MPSVPFDLNNRVDLVDSVIQINPVFPDYTRNPMKNNMKTKWKMLTLAALLSAGTTTAMAADNGYGGEYGDDAYFAETSDYVGGLYNDEAAEAATSANMTANNAARRGNAVTEAEYFPSDIKPVAYVGDNLPQQQYDSMGRFDNVGSGVSMGDSRGGNFMGGSVCGSSCGDSCGGSCRPARRSIFGQTGVWMTAEALLWFPQVRSTSPLVSTNGPGLSLELDGGPPPAQVAFGGNNAFGGDLQAGFRLDGGFMLSEDFGIGGRFWMLGESEDDFAREGTGAAGGFGIPFFDSDLVADQENSLQIMFNDGPGGADDFTGSVAARSALSIYGTEGYGRLRLLGGKGYRSDFIGGFSHFGIDEELTLVANTTQTSGAGAGINTIFIDNITAENRFFGGQLGFLSSVGRGAWTLTALTKVHMGSMDQTWMDRGSRQRVGTPAVPGGVFANTPDRTYSESNFCFAPEANLKLAYKLGPAMKFSVGYSFIMWDDVLMIGDNMNRNINGTYLEPDAGGGVLPAERPIFAGLETDSFFVHGIDLGLVFQF